jgi:dephospho-CoA kinase
MCIYCYCINNCANHEQNTGIEQIKECKKEKENKNKMKIIGLTGGSGAGKGEACKAFLSCGLDSLDTDKVSREVTRKGGDCLRELVENFSGSILGAYGELDRKKLAAIAFSSKKNLELLNNITHKYILRDCGNWIISMAKADRKAVIIDAPLLFESGFNLSCDIIVSVIADYEKRAERIIKRDNITREQAEKRLKSQKTDEFFLQNSDYIIYNNSDYSDVYIQALNIYRNIFPQ